MDAAVATGFAHAHRNFGSGKVKWAELIGPARRLAANGHTVSHETADRFARETEWQQQFDETKRIYLKGGRLWKPVSSGSSRS